MSEEKIKLISVKLYTEYYKNNIKDRYIRNYSDNVVIDNDVLKADYGECVYITPLDKHNKLQKYKEVIDNIKYYLEDSANQMSEEASYTLMNFIKEVE